MKPILPIVLICSLLSCSKGDSYCELPNELNGFSEIPKDNDPHFKVTVHLDYEQTFSANQEGTLFAFSTPDEFINPKGDYSEDIVDRPSYDYYLKDTLNPPSSVEIYAYAFNDCGESGRVVATVTYDTIP